MSSASTNNIRSPSIGSFEYPVSRKRWFILFAMTLDSFASGLCGQGDTILNVQLELLKMDLKTMAIIQQLVALANIPFTLPIAWLIDRCGLRFGFCGASITVLLRNLARGMFLYPSTTMWTELRYFYWISKAILEWLAYDFYISLPVKTSEDWFPVSERSTAWILPSIMMSLGSAIGAFLLPIYVSDIDTTYRYAYLNFACGLVTSTVMLLTVTRSKPKAGPPSQRAQQSSDLKIGYAKSLKSILTSKDYLLHFFQYVFFVGAAGSSTAYLQDILSSSGYDNLFCGMLVSICHLASIGFSLASSLFVSKINNISLACKLFSILTAITYCALLYTLQLRDSRLLIVGAHILYQAAYSASRPNHQNMTNHLCNGIIAEAANTALIIVGVVLIGTLCSYIFIDLTRSDLHNKDYSNSLMFLGIATAVPTILYSLFFQGRRSQFAAQTLEVEHASIQT